MESDKDIIKWLNGPGSHCKSIAYFYRNKNNSINIASLFFDILYWSNVNEIRQNIDCYRENRFGLYATFIEFEKHLGFALDRKALQRIAKLLEQDGLIIILPYNAKCKFYAISDKGLELAKNDLKWVRSRAEYFCKNNPINTGNGKVGKPTNEIKSAINTRQGGLFDEIPIE